MPVITVASKHRIHLADASDHFRSLAALTESFDGLDVGDDPTTVFFLCGSLHSTFREMHTHVTIDGLRVKVGYRNGEICREYGKRVAAYLIERLIKVAYHTVTVHIRAFEERTDIILTHKKELAEAPANQTN